MLNQQSTSVAVEPPTSSRSGEGMTGKIGVYLAGAIVAFLPLSPVHAENVTFAVIGPHEYELPVNFKDFDAFVQYGFTNKTNQSFTPNGGLTHIPNQDLNVGLTKIVRFITFDSLPNVGFAPEAIVPEIQANSGSGSNVYGIADPIFGGAVWVKPNKNSTFGFQTFITAPIGTKQFTSNFYSNISTIFYDYQFKNFDIDGNTGGVFRSDQRTPGADRLITGTTFFTDLRIGYKFNQPSFPIEPFFALDYEFTNGVKDAVTGLAVPNSNTEDLALGAGGVWTISDKYSLTIRYSRSVYGLNEPPTNAAYLKFVSILP